MTTALTIAGGWLALATAVALTLGRAIRVADVAADNCTCWDCNPTTAAWLLPAIQATQ